MSELKINLNKITGNSQEAPQEAPAPAEPAELYQQYASTRISTCLITPSGKRINFTNYEYYTNDPEIIAYLDAELSSGLRIVTKGKEVTKEDLNPAVALKRKIIEEFKASQEGRDFSEAGAKPKPGAGGAGTGAVSTAGVAN